MQEKTIPLTDVTVDNSLNPRQGALDQDAVLEYSQHIADLPPMQVFDIPGEGMVLVAGFHRYAAHQLTGASEGRFIVHQGDRVQAAERADLDNLKHGLRLNRAEKRAVIGRYLVRHPERSDAWVAKDCHTTDKTVRSVREELEAAGKIEVLHKLTGQDGIERPRSIEQPKRGDGSGDSQTRFEENGDVTTEPDQPAIGEWLDPAPANDAPDEQPVTDPQPQTPNPPPPPAKVPLPKPPASYRLSALLKPGALVMLDLWQIDNGNNHVLGQEQVRVDAIHGAIDRLIAEIPREDRAKLTEAVQTL